MRTEVGRYGASLDVSREFSHSLFPLSPTKLRLPGILSVDYAKFNKPGPRCCELISQLGCRKATYDLKLTAGFPRHSCGAHRAGSFRTAAGESKRTKSLPPLLSILFLLRKDEGLTRVGKPNVISLYTKGRWECSKVRPFDLPPLPGTRFRRAQDSRSRTSLSAERRGDVSEQLWARPSPATGRRLTDDCLTF